jgi:predicted AAA+ superfamily ATPase
MFENMLLFGMYPEVLTSEGQEKDVLSELVSSYLYKDILAYADIRKSDKLEKLVRALALQIGSEVNYSELAKLIGLDKNTVGNYIDILEKGFIVFRLPGFSRNVRNEIKKGSKVYFYDNGIRNMVIGNFLELDSRNDKGALWENFLVSERYKQHIYRNRSY